ncbi:hypothetical protein [Vibrio atlanticus]|uniref:hypothetical protein n=1 Tax=Vibrio atlanticus TaxID=693153 RepID=UPI00355033FD
MKINILMVGVVFGALFNCSAFAKVTLADAHASEKAYYDEYKRNHAEYERDLYKPLDDPQNTGSSGKDVISKSGYCESGAYGSHNVCVLADTTYSCFLSGVTKSTDESVAEIIRASGVWKLKVTNEGGRNWSEKQGFSWTCTKPS